MTQWSALTGSKACYSLHVPASVSAHVFKFVLQGSFPSRGCDIQNQTWSYILDFLCLFPIVLETCNRREEDGLKTGRRGSFLTVQGWVVSFLDGLWNWFTSTSSIRTNHYRWWSGAHGALIKSIPSALLLSGNLTDNHHEGFAVSQWNNPCQSSLR